MSFLVRPTAKGFRVIEETYTPERKVKTIPVLGYKALGFNPDMTLDEAKARAKQLNTQSNLDSKKIAGAVRRVELMNTEASAYLPAADVERFEAELKEIYEGNDYRLEITMRYWKAAQLCILELAIDPKDFRALNHRLFNYFKKNKWSHDYIKRITRILNMWGTCVCRFRGSMFEPIPKLTSMQVQAIADGRDDVDGVRAAPDPLLWPQLRAAKETFFGEGLTHHWNWMFIATWFGLRPHEVDNLRKGSKFWYIAPNDELGVEVLWVYQPKLIRIKKDDRWKPIPIYFPEQKAAVKLIQAQEFQRPLNKTLQRIFHEGIQVASPRKAFTDLMLEKGFDLVDVSTFMGHQKINRTIADYKNRKRFKLPKSG